MAIFNAGSNAAVKGAPVFSFTGVYNLIDEGDSNWSIQFLSSGALTFSKLGTGNGLIDIHCVGGGAGGGTYNYNSFGGGGGGGYAHTQGYVTIAKNTSYTVTVGDGGAPGQDGGASSFGSLCSANGGSGRNGGSAGGAGGIAHPEQGWMDRCKNGASNGGSTPNQSTGGGTGGTGQGNPPGTHDFGDASLTLRCGGGGSGKDYYGGIGAGGAGGGANGHTSALANTGGGGGGGSRYNSTIGSGGSGIVIIRNQRESVGD